jgi:hypothetical protein
MEMDGVVEEGAVGGGVEEEVGVLTIIMEVSLGATDPRGYPAEIGDRKRLIRI